MMQHIRKAAAMLLCLCILLTALCGCGNGEVIPAANKSREPQLKLSGDAPYQFPQISGVPWAKEANAELESLLVPFINALAISNSQYEVAHASYTLLPSSDGYLLGVYADGEVGSIHITDINLTDRGEVIRTEYALPEYLSDGSWLNGMLRLTARGVPLPDGSNTVGMFFRLFVDYYEAFSGMPADISAIRWQSDDTYYKKSVALGLCNNDYDYFTSDEELYRSGLADAISKLAERLYCDSLGRSSLTVSLDEFAAMTELFLRISFWQRLPLTQITEIAHAAYLTQVDDPDSLTRLDAACCFNSVWRESFGTLEPEYSEKLIDEPPVEAQLAFDMGFMSCFPSYGLFSSEFVLREYQLPELARNFADTCFWKSMVSEAFDMSFSDEQITLRDAIAALGWLDEMLCRCERPSGIAVVVDNSPNYQWYCSQFNTGRYSGVNCMPTICAMAIKWYIPDSAVTVEQLRNHYLEENDSGWYMYQVMTCMDDYGVSYREHDIDESIVECLDRGCIVLTQMSEAEYNASGHCLVIYGYRKLGDSVQFMVHDPGIYDGTDEFGKAPGEAMLLDSEYVNWIIWRIAYCYISVGEM